MTGEVHNILWYDDDMEIMIPAYVEPIVNTPNENLILLCWIHCKVLSLKWSFLKWRVPKASFPCGFQNGLLLRAPSIALKNLR